MTEERHKLACRALLCTITEVGVTNMLELAGHTTQAISDAHALAYRMSCYATTDDIPVPMILMCPLCSARHVDEGEFAIKSHATHACQACGFVWKPAKVPTVGVQFLPGYGGAK